MRLRRLATGLMAAVTAAVVVVATPPPPAAAQTGVVLMVVGSFPPNSADRALASVIEQTGVAVDFADDDMVDVSDADTVSAVVVSSTVTPSKVGDVFADVPVGVIVAEPNLFDDVDITAGPFFQGESPPTNRVDIVEDGHPIADGLSGRQFVTTVNRRLNIAVTDVGTTVATAPGTKNPVIVAVDAGEALADGEAAAGRRVALFPVWNSPLNLTSAGEQLIANAVEWAGDVMPPSNAAPQADAGDDQTLAAGVLVAKIDGAVTDDGVAGPVTTTWSGPAGVVFTEPTMLGTLVTFPGPGVYELTLTVDDTEFVDTDTMTVTVREPAGRVGFVSGRASGTPGDRPIIARLEAAGVVVEIIDDDAVAGFDVSMVDALFISTSVSISKVGTTFKDAAIPMAVWEAYLFEDLGMARRSRESPTKTQIVITDPADPLAAGLTGTQSVYLTSNRLSVAVLGGDGESIAHEASVPLRSALFRYAEGSTLADGSTAAGLRIGLFPDYFGAQRLSANGQAIVDAVIAEILDAGSPGPTITTPAAVTVLEGQEIAVDIDATDDVDTEGAGLTYEITDGDDIEFLFIDEDTGVLSFFDAVDFEFDGDNVYEVEVTVTDSDGLTDVVVFTITVADVPEQWAVGFGIDFGTTSAVDVAVDSDGNSYVIGFTPDTDDELVDVDPDPGRVRRLVGQGLREIFLIKYAPDGRALWVRNIGGIDIAFPRSVTVGADGNVYVAGGHQLGLTVPTVIDRFDGGFVIEFAPDGTFLSILDLDGQSPRVNDVAVDDDGTMYISGTFFQSLTLPAGPNTTSTTLNSSNNSNEGFVAVFDDDRDLLWARVIGDDGNDGARGIAVDDFGDVYVSGNFSESLDVDENTELESNGLEDGFVMKLDASGDVQWARAFGSAASELLGGSEIAVDQSGGVYVVSRVAGDAEFDPDTSGPEVTFRGGDSDAVLAKYNTDGGFEWVRSFGGSSTSFPAGLALDGTDVVITGGYSGTIDADPGTGVEELTSAGDFDAFVIRLNEFGDLVWARSFGDTGRDQANAVAVSRSGVATVVGAFEGSLDVNPGPGVETVTGGQTPSTNAFVFTLDADGLYG